ncbi:hypothetical protein QBC35DRAFT_348296, partial [Podospora australis]
LSCPFYVRDPLKYFNCFAHPPMGHIEEVQLHLRADHRRPPQCPICHENFDTFVACDRHIRERLCTPSPEPVTLDGLTEDQIHQVCLFEPNPAQTAQNNWTELWKICF